MAVAELSIFFLMLQKSKQINRIVQATTIADPLVLYVDFKQNTRVAAAYKKSSLCFRLSGISPFLGETLGDTYVAVEKGEWEFDDEAFEGISEAAKDFISKLLIMDQKCSFIFQTINW